MCEEERHRWHRSIISVCKTFWFLPFAIAFPQTRSLLYNEEQLDENSIRLPDFYDLIEDFHDQTCADDYSSALTFPTALNSCYQRNLLQLSRHYQSIVNHPLPLPHMIRTLSISFEGKCLEIGSSQQRYSTHPDLWTLHKSLIKRFNGTSILMWCVCPVEWEHSSF